MPVGAMEFDAILGGPTVVPDLHNTAHICRRSVVDGCTTRDLSQGEPLRLRQARWGANAWRPGWGQLDLWMQMYGLQEG